MPGMSAPVAHAKRLLLGGAAVVVTLRIVNACILLQGLGYCNLGQARFVKAFTSFCQHGLSAVE